MSQALLAQEPSARLSPISPSAAAERTELLIGRRDASRHPVDIAARFIAQGINVRVQLEDISASGACFRMLHPRPLHAGRLCWLEFEAFGELIWQRDERCGIRFEDRLLPDFLRQTLDFAEKAAASDGERYLRLASAWVHGPGDY